MFEKIKKEYSKNGYAIIRNIIDANLISEIQGHVNWLSKKYPDIHPESFHHHLLVHDPFIHHLLNNKNLLDLVEQIIGSDIAVFGVHYIAKKPYDGKPVGWHQDGSYWSLEPMKVLSLWLAGTDSTAENACMRVIPGTHKKKLLKPSEMINLNTEDFVLELAMHPDEINHIDAVNIELKAGDISIHNPLIVHGSNPNISDKWRIGLTLRYIPTSTYVNKRDWKCILLRGNSTNGINNNYITKPVFNQKEHMSFIGQEFYY